MANSYFVRGDKSIAGGVPAELERMRDKLDTAFDSVETAVVGATFGIKGTADVHSELPAASGLDESTIYIVTTDEGENKNGLWQVQSDAWVFLGALNLQDADEVVFTPAGSIEAVEVQAALEEVDGDVTGHVGTVTGNPHGVTKAEVGLTDVPDLDTTSAVGNDHTHANSTELDKVTDGDHDVSDGTSHANVTKIADVQLTNDQMIALNGTPINVIESPGSNNTIIVHRIAFVSDSVAAAWSEAGDNIVLEYAGATDILEIETSGLIDTGSLQFRTQAPTVDAATPEENVAVRLLNSGNAFGGGNAVNTFSIRVWYHIVPTVAFGA